MKMGKLEKINGEIRRNGALVLLALLLLVPSVLSVPTPKGISGKVYDLDGVTVAGAGTPFSVTNLNNGQHIEGVTGYGSSGRYSVALNGENGHQIEIRVWNIEHESIRTVTLDGVMRNVDLQLNLTLSPYPPNITSEPVTEALQDTLYQYQMEVTDVNHDDIMSYYLVDGPDTMSVSESLGAVAWMPLNDDVGENNIILMVSDGTYNITQEYVITVENVNDAPEIVSGPLTSVLEDAAYTYDVNAEDIDGDELYYSLVSSPDAMQIDPISGEIFWLPTNDDVGMHNVTILANDSELYDLQSFNLLVQNVNDAPAIISVPNTTAVEDVLYEYDIVASDVDDTFLNYSMISGPPGMSVDLYSGLLVWEPTNEDVGQHEVVVSVSDGKVASNQSFVINVLNVNDAPIISTTPSTEVAANSDYVYDVNATDDDGDTIFYSISGAPDGMGIDSETGMIYWRPKNKDAGAYDVIVSVSDGHVDVNQEFELNVISVPEYVQARSSSRREELSQTLSSQKIVRKAYDPKKKTVSFEVKDSPVDEINIRLKKDVPIDSINIEEFVSRPEGAPSSVPRKVYIYLKIEHELLTPDSVESASIRFKVSKNWLMFNSIDAGNVILNRFNNNQWNILPTSYVDQDDNYYYYESNSPGFSYFAVSARDVVEPNSVKTSNIPNAFSVYGTLYLTDNVQAPEGTYFRLYNINNSANVTGETGIGPFTGNFFATINGNAGDVIVLEVGTSGRHTFVLDQDIVEVNFIYDEDSGSFTYLAPASIGYNVLISTVLIKVLFLLCIMVIFVLAYRYKNERKRK